MARPLRCRLRLHSWEYRENPDTHEYYQVCVRCNAYRDRGNSALDGRGAWGLGVERLEAPSAKTADHDAAFMDRGVMPLTLKDQIVQISQPAQNGPGLLRSSMAHSGLSLLYSSTDWPCRRMWTLVVGATRATCSANLSAGRSISSGR